MPGSIVELIDNCTEGRVNWDLRVIIMGLLFCIQERLFESIMAMRMKMAAVLVLVLALVTRLYSALSDN